MISYRNEKTNKILNIDEMYKYVFENMPENRKKNYYPKYFYQKKKLLIENEIKLNYLPHKYQEFIPKKKVYKKSKKKKKSLFKSLCIII